jgi:hypothetical protein
VEFNAQMTYGEDIVVMRRERDANGKISYKELLPADAPDIYDFIENTNYRRIVMELGNDIALFGRGFIELILNENGGIAQMRHLEAAYSRVSRIDAATGKSEWHGYSAGWHNNKYSEDLNISPLLDMDNPMYDFKVRMGLLPDGNGKLERSSERRFVMDVSLPSPGRFYYPKPAWWSVYESQWFDFASAIPELKLAFFKYGMTLKYHIQVSRKYYENLYKEKGAVSVKEKQQARKEFLQKINDMLSGKDNAGKAFVSEFSEKPDSHNIAQDVIITPLKLTDLDGKYIEDSQDAMSNICFAQNVHPMLVGAAPGKGGNINGTEARELFMIKQALCKPWRDQILLPLYMAKAANKWDAGIEFRIANIALTTIDNGTGSVKQVGDQKMR